VNILNLKLFLVLWNCL